MILDVDIIIVNYNTRETLIACLSSIERHPPSALGRVFVVDNASNDGSVEAVRAQCPSVEVVALTRNVGFGAANNVAIRASGASLVLLLNSDTIVGPGSLDLLIARLEATSVVAAGPRLRDAAGRVEISYGRMLSPLNEMVQVIRQRAATADLAIARWYVARLMGREREVDWVSGACLLVRRQAAVDAGLFDERYFLYEEDVDFCAALRARGGKILFTPRAQIIHLRGASAATQAPAAAAPSESRLRQDDGGAAEASGEAPANGGAAASGAWRAMNRSLHSHYDRSHAAFYEKHSPRWAPVLRWWQTLRGRAPHGRA